METPPAPEAPITETTWFALSRGEYFRISFWVRFRRQMVLGAVLGVLYLVIKYGLTPPERYIQHFLLFCGTLVVALGVLLALYALLVLWLMYRKDNQGLFTPLHLAFYANRVTFERQGIAKGEYQWAAFRKSRQIGNATYLYVSATAALLITPQAFATPAAYQRFLDLLAEHNLTPRRRFLE